ncbi:MAG: zinc ribbon domain-containing protein, partial [Myxococcota bacterium]
MEAAKLHRVRTDIAWPMSKPSPQTKCPACGASIETPSNFCGQCGYDLSNTEVEIRLTEDDRVTTEFSAADGLPDTLHSQRPGSRPAASAGRRSGPYSDSDS